MMRWRTSTTTTSTSPTGSNNQQLDSPSSAASSSCDVKAEKISGSIDEEDEPDMTSQELASSSDDDQHRRLGNYSAETPLSADEVVEAGGMSNSSSDDQSGKDEEDETKQSEDRKSAADDDPDKRIAIEDDEEGTDHAEPQAPSIPWKPQNVQSTCEFTHTITDYSQKRESGCKKAEYSATTVDEFGNRWRLIVYVNGNGRASNNHLSLFLQVADADDLPFGWKKAVSYVLTLEHPSGGSLSYAKRNPDKTFKLCPKAIDWGWSQFITSDRIQQEGFVSNDSLTVRASVTVKSSSVSIDEEDSELYLKCAVEEGNVEAVRLCLEQGASVNCKFKDDLYTPLHTACSSGTNSGSMEVLNLLLERGADGNACNKWKETPLLIAANNGHRAAVEALLKHGADPSMCSEAGWSALTFAAHKGYDDIVALLLQAGAPVNCRVIEDFSMPLHKACAGSKPGHLASVKLLLEGGADVHSLNKWRETPLLTAANHGQAGAVELLLKAGADPCKCTDTGWSPLSIAAYKGHDHVVRLLLEADAPTEEEDPTLSALLQAATKGLPDTVELLLRHGADHTVTTKKGDTALSILVEQNLIDAAVEMVTEYNASISRCSRDRKKVQRARLLINLRMKQQEREGRNAVLSTDEDETDDEGNGTKLAQHDVNGITTPDKEQPSKKKKKGKTAKVSAEEKARAAEEALLLELEQEDAKAKEAEAEANSKRAKKKKKKERERQMKMKEEEERRERERREAEERERERKEQELKEQRAREQRLQEQKEREMKEMIEKEKLLAVKRKEREKKEREQQKKKTPEQVRKEGTMPTSPSGSLSSTEKKTKIIKGKKNAVAAAPAAVDTTQQQPQLKKAVSAHTPVAPAPITSNRRWETKSNASPAKTSPQTAAQVASNYSDHSATTRSVSHSDRNDSTQNVVRNSAPQHVPSVEPLPPSILSTRSVDSFGNGASPVNSYEKNVGGGVMSQQSQPVNGTYSGQSSPSFVGIPVEHPAISIFRRNKVTDLIQKCSVVFNIVDEVTVKKVIYRWIVRASHDQVPYVDPIIPSWLDTNLLVPYFQRQFISENRRQSMASSPGHQIVNMEALKEAGATVAVFCQEIEKEIGQFRRSIESGVPRDWNDAFVGMTAVNSMRNGSGSCVTVSWGSHSQVVIPTSTFTALRERYVGSTNRFLSAVFVAKVMYDIKRSIVTDTSMDFRLPATTLSALATELSVSAELWSDPFSARSTNVFWGNFEEVDCLFGGQKPFSKDELGGEEVLARHGGSLSVLCPFDNMLATRYISRMLDIIDAANASGVPVSFAAFVHAEAFHDFPACPSRSSLNQLDIRLGDPQRSYIRFCEVLAAGQHAYQCGDGAGIPKISAHGTIFVVLQSEAGKVRFPVSEASVTRIIRSMAVATPVVENPIVTPISFSNNFLPRDTVSTPRSDLFEGLAPTASLAPHTPDPQLMGTSEYGAIGGATISKQFLSPDPMPRFAGRRGRLFDLVDDVDEDQMNDTEVDIVSGMLNNLDVDLFHNTVGPDVDIEAISLMGIGGPPHSMRSARPQTNSRPHTNRFG